MHLPGALIAVVLTLLVGQGHSKPAGRSSSSSRSSRSSGVPPCTGHSDPVSDMSRTTLEALLATTSAQLPPGELGIRQEQLVRLGCDLLQVMRKERFSKKLRKYINRLDLDLDISTFVDDKHIKEKAEDIHQTLHAFQEYVYTILKDLGGCKIKTKQTKHKKTKAALCAFKDALQSLRCVYVVADERDLGDWRVPPELRRVKDVAFRSIRDFVVVRSIVQYVEKLLGGKSRCGAARSRCLCE